ncbi:hypothetical protein [Nocardia xishanensis]|uniref:hypothetical protein n=1 Tax=Nocardia xishanensis TaxID=238964 RepID=UPI00342E7E74
MDFGGVDFDFGESSDSAFDLLDFGFGESSDSAFDLLDTEDESSESFDFRTVTVRSFVH